MDVVIALGGKGERLKDITHGQIPKPLVPVSNQPFLTYLLDNVLDQNIVVKRFIFLTGFLGDQIEDFYGTNYRGIPILYSREMVPLGTGGALKLAVEKYSLRTLIFLNGDTIHSLDYKEFLSLGQRLEVLTSGAMLISSKVVPDAGRYGTLSANIPEVNCIKEKTGLCEEALIYTGTALMNAGFLLDLPMSTFDFSTVILAKLAKEKRLFTYTDDAYFIDIGIPEDYSQFKIKVNNG